MLSVANESNFNVNRGLYAVKFWATWCGPCKVFTPVIEKLDEEYKDIKFLSIDVDHVSELAKRFKISSLPTILLLSDGEEVGRILGVQLIQTLRTQLDGVLSQYGPPVEDKVIEEPVLDQAVSG